MKRKSSQTPLFSRIEQNSLAEQVVSQLAEAMDRGRLQPGQALPPRDELARDFGVNPGVISEALKALVLMGRIEQSPGFAAVVAGSPANPALESPDPAYLRELRNSLECRAMLLACRKAGAEEVKAIRLAVAEMEELYSRGWSGCAIDACLHRAIVEAGGSRPLAQLHQALFQPILSALPRKSTNQGSLGEKLLINANHLAIAIARHDADAGLRALREHFSLH